MSKRAMEEHGRAIDAEGRRISCNYCGKVVSGNNRLKHHLGGVGKDVVACIQVPEGVKVRMRGLLLEHKKGRMVKEMDKLTYPDLPLMRNLSPPSAEVRELQLKPAEPTGLNGGKSVDGNRCYLYSSQKGNQVVETARADANGNGFSMNSSQNGGQIAEAVWGSALRNFHYLNPTPSGKQLVESSGRSVNSNGCYVNISRPTSMGGSSNGAIGNRSSSSSWTQEPELVMKEVVKDDSAAASIGKFIFDAGLDPDVVQLPSFKGMVDAVLACGVGIAIPTSDDLKGPILQQQLEEIQHRAEGLKQHWQETGCSVILDSWKSQCGRSLMSVLVHCTHGMLFLRSMDVSAIIDDVDELALMLCQVVEYVGVQNIIQVITNDASPYMQAAQHAVVKKHGCFFFTLCADHCMNLLLEDIAALHHVNKVLMKAKQITRFIYSQAVPMALKHKYIRGRELLSSSSLKFVAQFITLENLVSEKENLVKLFSSAEWITSDLASQPWCGHIPDLVRTDNAFWRAAADIVKLTNPLVGVLYKLEADNCPMGILYDAMDCAKEDIEKNLRHQHDDFWVMIDKIWDNYLHSPIHSSAYFLNPRLFYSPRFRLDTEVTSGIAACIIRMARGHHDQEMMVAQIEVYRSQFGGFDSDAAIEQIMTIPQVQWWSAHGGATPELQQLAIRILSQTCSGASRYNLDKGLSEQLHAVKRSYLEQERFRSMEYVHYNLLLAHYVPRVDGTSGVRHGKPTQLDDWISEVVTTDNHLVPTSEVQLS